MVKKKRKKRIEKKSMKREMDKQEKIKLKNQKVEDPLGKSRNRQMKPNLLN